MSAVISGSWPGPQVGSLCFLMPTGMWVPEHGMAAAAGKATFLLWLHQQPLGFGSAQQSSTGCVYTGKIALLPSGCRADVPNSVLSPWPLPMASSLVNREDLKINRVNYWFVFLDGKWLKKQLYGENWEDKVWFHFGHQSPNSVVYKPRCCFVKDISTCQELHPSNCIQRLY